MEIVIQHAIKGVNDRDNHSDTASIALMPHELLHQYFTYLDATSYYKKSSGECNGQLF
jgi:hypothetical protein